MQSSNIRSFRKLLRRLERLLISPLKDYCCGVTLAQCHALLEIEERGETTLVDMTKSMNLDKSTLSRTVDGLANIGLVKRVPHPSDRRFTLLTLTKQGKGIAEKLNNVNDGYFKSVFDVIPREKHGGVIEHLEYLVEGIAQIEQKRGEGSCCSL